MPTNRTNSYQSLQDALNQFAEQYRRDYATSRQQANRPIQILGPAPNPNDLQRPQPIPAMAPPCDHTWEPTTPRNNPVGPYDVWIERCIHCNDRRQRLITSVGLSGSTIAATPRGGRVPGIYFDETMSATSREEYDRMMEEYRERERELRAKRDTERRQEKARQDRLNDLMHMARAPREYRTAPLEKRQEIEANVRRLWRHEVRSGLIDGAPAKEVQEPHRHEWIEAGTDQRSVFVKCAGCNEGHWIARVSWGRLLRTAAREHEPVSLREFGWDDEADNGPEAVYPDITANAINF